MVAGLVLGTAGSASASTVSADGACTSSACLNSVSLGFVDDLYWGVQQAGCSVYPGWEIGGAANAAADRWKNAAGAAAKRIGWASWGIEGYCKSVDFLSPGD